MLAIPRRYSHFVFGVLQSGLTCAIAAAIASFPFIKAGGFVQVYAGGEYRLGDKVAVQASVGYQVDDTKAASNGSVRFTRVPVELLGFYSFTDKFRAGERASKCTMTSVSLLVWKIEPLCSSLRRHSAAFVKFPLCPTEIFPLLQSIMIGCAFSSALSPAVEYRVCPIEAQPGSLSSTSGLKISSTSPIARCAYNSFPSVETIPADSCPRCCNAYKPR